MHITRVVPLWIITAAMSFTAHFCIAQGQGKAPSQEKRGTPESSTIEMLRSEIAALKADYENRIQQLENRLEELQKQMLRNAPETTGIAPPSFTPPSATQIFSGTLNPAISVVGNMVARADSQKVFNEEDSRIDNKINLREAEIDMRVPVDPYADGVLITSIESEAPGEFSAGVEEGYVNIKKLPFIDQPPLGLKIKAGRFRPLFGKTNIFHTHDLPQTFRPLSIQEFLGPEGFAGDGISMNFFLPTPGEKTSLDLTLEVLTGGGIAASPDPESRMAYLGHLRFFHTFGETHNLEVGWSSYFHPEGNGIRDADIHGLDFLYRWKPFRQGEWKSFILSGEFLFGRRAYPEAALSPEAAEALSDRAPGSGTPVGYYLSTQWQFNRRTYAGVRWDQTDVLFDPALKRSGITPFVSYYFSEFLRFRLNYEHRWSDLFTEDGRNSLYSELNFVFGSHPPEPYWVNK